MECCAVPVRYGMCERCKMSATKEKNGDPDSSIEDLDTAFSPSAWCQGKDPDVVIQEYIKASDEESAQFSRGTGFEAQLDIPYGNGVKEKFDVYIPESVARDAPVYIYIHGGYWQEPVLSKSNNCLMAGPLIRRGAVVVVMSYTLAPEGTIPNMAKQVERVIQLTAKKFPETRGIYISGHSAGGHLSAMMLSVDWSKRLANGRQLIKGVLPMSGVFDLRPLVKTYLNKPLQLTESSAAAVSPSLLVSSIPEANLGIKVCLPYAEFDPPKFHEQSEDYCKLLKARGFDVSTMRIPGKNHFDELTDMMHDWSPLQKMNFKVMELTP